MLTVRSETFTHKLVHQLEALFFSAREVNTGAGADLHSQPGALVPPQDLKVASHIQAATLATLALRLAALWVNVGHGSAWTVTSTMTGELWR